MNKASLTVGVVQEQWHESPKIHQARLANGILTAAKQGARLVCLQELTLSPYFCTRPDVDGSLYQEDLYNGPTTRFLSQCAKDAEVFITASLFENAGYNTAVAYNPQGELIGYTRKQHIPSGEKYHEDHYFKVGDSNYPIHSIAGHHCALPTCYDQWFPELSRIYSLKGAEVIIYPTAIGEEPTAPGFDTRPMWQKSMIGQAITSNAFIIAVNRIGCEDGLTFYGSSFICNPFGELLATAPRNEPAVIVTTLDFSERQLWSRLFPFAHQRTPETYHSLVNDLTTRF